VDPSRFTIRARIMTVVAAEPANATASRTV
jgi:hypothetical protein